MSWPHTTAYASYGAFELKATYQRNMLLGSLSVLVLTGLLLLVFRIMVELSVTPPPIVTSHGENIVSRIRPVPKIIPEQTVGLRPPARPQTHGSVPVAIPDSLIPDLDQAVPSQGELGAGIGDASDSGSGFPSGSVGDSGIPGGTPEQFPSDTQTIIVERLPEIVYMPKPAYPESARRLGFSGSGVVKALVDKEGRVRDAKIVRSSGYDSLDQAAVEAAFKCVYTPAIQNGHPVAIWISYRVQFRLGD